MRRGTGEYPEGWDEFARQLKEQAGWKCIRCGHPHDPASGHTLTVHHVTMDKAEPFDHWWAFLVLCQVCHLQIQAKVVMERVWYLPHSEWFRPYVAGYYARLYGLPDDREYVTANLDYLIALGQGREEVTAWKL